MAGIRRASGRFWAAILLALAIGPALAGEHQGIASCSGSTCHGRLAPTGPVVRQNELITWQDESSPAGAHSKAWRALTEARGEAIAARLGLGPAEKSPTCLGCHSDSAPGDTFGKAFQISDGVTCEACHGAASGWLANHYAVGASHKQNISNGLVPLDDAKTRASVCLDCHFGSADHAMTHRIMAAGHPRLSFELDLFGALQSHYDFDADYARRKHVIGGVKLWAVGQAMALNRVLTGFAGDQGGMFPEFYYYDCQSCHRPLTSTRDPQVSAVSNPDRREGRGQPVFDDENMIMLSAAVDVAAPDMAARFRTDTQNFHAALAQSRASAADAAAKLAGTCRVLATALDTHNFTRADTFAILDNLLSGGAVARYTDYAGGAQAVMAIDTLLNALVTAKEIDRGAAQAIRPDIDRLYADVHDPNAYRISEFRDTLSRVASAVRRLR